MADISTIEQIIVRDMQKALEFVGLSVVTDGTNPALKSPMVQALSSMGIETASILEATDAEVGLVTAADLPLFIILVKSETIDMIIFACTLTDWAMGDRSEKPDQFVARLKMLKESLMAKARTDYGFTTAATLVGGSLAIDDAAKDSDTWTSFLV